MIDFRITQVSTGRLTGFSIILIGSYQQKAPSMILGTSYCWLFCVFLITKYDYQLIGTQKLTSVI